MENKNTQLETKKESELMSRIRNLKIFTLLKSRYFMFAVLAFSIIFAIFCLFLIDGVNSFRRNHFGWLENNFLKNILISLNIPLLNINIVSWAFIFVIFIFVFTGLLVWAFYNSLKIKYVISKNYVGEELKKRTSIYNLIFFSIICSILAIFVVLFIVVILNSDVMKAWQAAKKPIAIGNFFQAIGAALALYVILLFNLFLLFVLFKIIVAIVVLFVGSVSKGVWKRQGYPINNGGSNMYNSNQNNSQIMDAKNVFPALTSIDDKFKNVKIPNVKGATFEKSEVNKKGTKTIKLTPETDPNNHIKDLAIRFQAFLANKNDLYFSLEIIRAFIAGMNASRLILLEGLSGTGKTTLPRMFNEFIGGKSSFFPVQATWKDRSDIVGYYSDFTKQFKETEFLKILYESAYHPDKFNIMVLDEMNISRVEYYFADFLSILEYPEKDWLIPLINNANQNNMPKYLEDGKIRVTNNTWFVGTINVDDSTFTVSDKVYDRVIVIDFKELSTPFKCKANDEPYNITPKELLDNFAYISKQEMYHLNKAEKEKFTKLCSFASETFDISFGNRIVNQICNFVPVYVALGGSKIEGIDFMFARKILRKIDGKYENYISVGLTKFSKYLQTLYGKGHFKETEAYIQKLRNKLS